MQEEIAARSQQLVEAVNTGDLEAVAALYTEDAWLLPPNAELIEGREAIRDFYATLREDAGLRDMEAEILDLETAGDLAYEVGRYALTLDGEEGPLRDVGKYLFTWRREHGEWLIAADAPNSDLAPA